jgi:putative Holliday junction resolvase
MPASPSSILALDVGGKRIGVAIASVEARLPRPLITLQHDDTLFPTLETIIEVEGVKRLVVGFPRGMQGQHTAQTTAIEDFVTELKQHVALPVVLQDEALTSKHAEDELRARGKPYQREDIDSLAATYILDDYLKELQQRVA